ncbi:hypothetical protein, partial [Aeromonas veronii]|uniref:hypothetical protein n=1 Tax=Aeromonas veronii TaxID=654 RepID=UPI002F3ED1E6
LPSNHNGYNIAEPATNHTPSRPGQPLSSGWHLADLHSAQIAQFIQKRITTAGCAKLLLISWQPKQHKGLRWIELVRELRKLRNPAKNEKQWA